jgi:hypothetical protein
MFNLIDKNISYLLISPEKETHTDLENKSNCERACSILYSKDYTVLSVKGYYEGKYENSFLAIPNQESNDDLRKDALLLLKTFNQDCVIIKYLGEESATKIQEDGSEKPLETLVYNSDLNNKTYLYDGVSFSFVEKKRYFFPTKKEDLKTGMVLEYLHNTNWVKKEVFDLEREYLDLYKLMMKYNKLRVEVN